MVKHNNETLGLRKESFRKNIISKRLSKKRLKIHQKINIIKKRFRTKRDLLFTDLDNKDNDDIISHEPVKNISKFDLFIFNEGNLKLGTSASNLVQWMSMSTSEEIPKNPFTNLPLIKVHRDECFKIAKNFLYKNKLSSPDSVDNKILEKKMQFFLYNEILRSNPQLMIILDTIEMDCYLAELHQFITFEEGQCYCYKCLQYFNEFAPSHQSREDINYVKYLGYILQSINLKIDDIKNKIEK